MREENSSLEELLELIRLEPLEVNLFRGSSRDIGTPRVFGGQVLAQAVLAARQTVEDSTQLYAFTRVIQERFSDEERIGMIEMLWEVAYADGHLHEYESSLVRRVSGLIYVADRDSGAARKRVRQRLEAAELPPS